LGLKGTISELELHTIRSRLAAGLLAKAARGELALCLPVGLTRGPTGVVVKDPDIAEQQRLELIFHTFLKVRTVAKVMRVRNERGLSFPAVTGMVICAGRERQSRQLQLRWRLRLRADPHARRHP
jgi:DNA invertase Pin-like site-specific DNA recombinase